MAGASLRLLLLVTLAAAHAFAIPTVRIRDLPSHPEHSCATDKVKSVLSGCAVSGPTATCCQAIDAVFANTSSISYGCLCYPQVLYKAAVRASASGLDVFGLLHKCRQKHQVAFQTQWAAAEPTGCPRISLSARTADMITMLDRDVILPDSRSRPLWSWHNLRQFGEVNEHLSDIRNVWEQLFGLQTVKLLLIIIISTAPVFLFMHSAVLMRSAAYRELSPAERMIVCQHSVYAVVFGLSMGPQTLLALIAMFRSWTGGYFSSPHLTALCGLFLASRAMLYIVEASTRSVIKRSWLLIVHHQLFFLIIVMGVWTQNTAVLGIGIVLDLFACHEAPLYLSLLAYRLKWRPGFTCAMLRIACAWYVITRAFQTATIVFMVIEFSKMPAIRKTPEFIVTSLLFGAFTIIQVYTLVIYHAIYKKVMRERQAPKIAVVGRNGVKVILATPV